MISGSYYTYPHEGLVDYDNLAHTIPLGYFTVLYRSQFPVRTE